MPSRFPTAAIVVALAAWSSANVYAAEPAPTRHRGEVGRLPPNAARRVTVSANATTTTADSVAAQRRPPGLSGRRTGAGEPPRPVEPDLLSVEWRCIGG